MGRTTINWILLFGIIGAVLVADQITKTWVLNNMQLGQTIEAVPSLAPFFQITRSQNTGSAFGLFPQAGNFFLVIALVVSVGLVIYAGRLPQNALYRRIAIGLVCGGALGNAVDRIQHGVVVDFIHYRIPNVISNVSNIADHAIVFGVLFIFVYSWRAEQAEKRAAAEAERTEESDAPEPNRTT